MPCQNCGTSAGEEGRRERRSKCGSTLMYTNIQATRYTHSSSSMMHEMEGVGGAMGGREIRTTVSGSCPSNSWSSFVSHGSPTATASIVAAWWRVVTLTTHTVVVEGHNSPKASSTPSSSTWTKSGSNCREMTWNPGGRGTSGWRRKDAPTIAPPGTMALSAVGAPSSSRTCSHGNMSWNCSALRPGLMMVAFLDRESIT